MPTRRNATSAPTDKTQQILSVLQDLFILEGLKVGMNVDDLRKILKIDKRRITNISKHIKQGESRGKRK